MRSDSFLKKVILPSIRGLLGKGRSYGYFGDYASWEEALKDCDGYDSSIILNKVCEATLKAKNGKAAYERDSVLFDKVQYSWPLLAMLMKIAHDNGSCLDVVDFGGALGSTYYQNKEFLSTVKNLRWRIVEQKSFVDCGRKYFEDENLAFFYDLDSVLQGTDVDVAILSGVLPYVRDPYKVLDEVIDRKIPNIIIDRTAFLLDGTDDRLTVQKVSPDIYKASYPAWFLSRRKVLDRFKGKYQLIAEFPTSDWTNIDSKFLGMIFKRADGKH